MLFTWFAPNHRAPNDLVIYEGAAVVVHHRSRVLVHEGGLALVDERTAGRRSSPGDPRASGMISSPATAPWSGSIGYSRKLRAIILFEARFEGAGKDFCYRGPVSRVSPLLVLLHPSTLKITR